MSWGQTKDGPFLGDKKNPKDQADQALQDPVGTSR